MIHGIAWDFDGVLNRNKVDGQLLWSRSFDADIGPLASFVDAIFGANWPAILTGAEDLLPRVAAWCAAEQIQISAEEVLAYWFAKDDFPDPQILALADRLKARGLPQVIATNNEPRRTQYIADTMGMAARVGPVLSSGRLGLAKPDPAFFARIADHFGQPPETLLFIDDTAKNIAAAAASGWQVFHMTDHTRDQLAQTLPLASPNP